jgi:hypothetical protein
MASYNDDIAKIVAKMVKEYKKSIVKNTKNTKSAKGIAKKAEAKLIYNDINIKSKPKKAGTSNRTIGSNSKSKSISAATKKALIQDANAIMKKKRRPPEPPMAGVR